jgi:predicted secreted protein
VRKLFLILFIAVLILPACSRTNRVFATPGPRATFTALPDRPTPSAAELELSDPDKPIEVKAGEDFTITVRTQPNPNYHWEIAQTLDPKVVEYIWKNHIPDHLNVQNSRGKDIWRFKALAPGETTIILGYYNGQTDETLEKFAFSVVVK